ncbi:hypothetical protein Tco_1040573 [Tanacetum coccineum]
MNESLKTVLTLRNVIKICRLEHFMKVHCRDGSLRSVAGVDHVPTSELNANTTPTTSDIISYIGDAEIANSSFDDINETLVEKQYVNVPNTGTRNFTGGTRNFIASPDMIFKRPISDINVVSPTSSIQNGSAKKNGGVQVGNEPVNDISSSYATKPSLTSSTKANL